jgi:hypothetical protein
VATSVAQPVYTCAVCGLAVIILLPQAEAIRACPHEDAGIIANLGASLAGAGGVSV